jgi:hypothetical protein
MPYLVAADVDGFATLLLSFPLDHATVDAWLSTLPPAYVNNLPTHAQVSNRLRAVLVRLNTDPPLDGSAIPIAIVLGWLTTNQPNSVLVDRAKQLLSQIVVGNPGQAPSVQTVFTELRLNGAALFADRESLRQRLVRLARPDGPAAVIVNGGEDVGKSHTRWLVAHASQKSAAFRFAWVEIEKEQAADYTADWLIEELVHSLVPAADGLPARREPLKRWIGDLATWTVRQLSTLGNDRPIWLVIDGIRHPSIHPEVRAAVERLAAVVSTQTGVVPLRLVLIDCDPASVLSTGIAAEQESVDHLTHADAQSFLQTVLDAASFATKWQNVQGAQATTIAISKALEEALR